MFEDKPLDSEKYMEEIEAMAKLDCDVINVSIRSTRGTIVRQFYKGTLLSSITAWFARSKKVSAQRISAFTKSEDHSCIQDTDLAFYINQPNRGGASLWVRHNDEEWIEYDITQYTTVEDFMQMQGWQLYHLQYKGAQLDGAVRLADLKSDCVDLTATLPPTWLRTRSSCLKSRILTLVELTEWFLPDQIVSPDMAAQDILQIAINQFNTAKAYYVLNTRREHHPMRGGGKQAGQGGKLVWESTRTIKGLKLLTEVTAAGTVVPIICIDEVCKDTTGIAMSLINTWNARLQGIESKQPLLLLFPGRCKEVLLRLGAAQVRLNEMELLYIDENTQKIFRRQTTTLSLSDHAYQYGKDLQSVEWLPSASVEYQLELDTRWSAQAVVDAAQQDWRELVARLASKLCVGNIPKEEFYALRAPAAVPLIWTARLRLEPEKGEKLLCGSGLESLFVRHADTEHSDQKASFTIIWGPKHLEASPQALTTLLQQASAFPGHRGLARSAIGIGLRVKWQARQLIRPEDPCLQYGNQALQDTDLYAVHGAPAAASGPEVAKYFAELNWPVIPKSKLASRTSTTWYSTASKPPATQFKWAGSFMYVEPANHEELRQQRSRQTKKREKAQTAWGAAPIRQTVMRDTTGNVQKDSLDPLQQNDPWQRSTQLRSSVMQSPPSSSSSGSKGVMQQNDPRIEAMMVRLDTLEEKSAGMESHLSRVDHSIERVEHSVEQVGVSMTTQFSAVLQEVFNNLQNLQKDSDEHKRLHARNRQLHHLVELAVRD